MSSPPGRVAIVDYKLNNIRSVRNALELLGAEVVVAASPAELENADRIVLPGVGSFPDAMRRLHAEGWIPALGACVLDRRVPFLGICLGMQLLATTGTEHECVEGLGWIPGTVELLRPTSGARVPHIGWNDARVTRPAVLFAGDAEPGCYYYVHSYVLAPVDPEVVSATCEYGGKTFAAALERDNVFATQFHPEKSQRAGLGLLRRFLDAPCSARA